MYSNGLSEIILGKAIKQLNLPRDQIVVMTKVCKIEAHVSYFSLTPCAELQLYRFIMLFPVHLGNKFLMSETPTTLAMLTSMV